MSCAYALHANLGRALDRVVRCRRALDAFSKADLSAEDAARKHRHLVADLERAEKEAGWAAPRLAEVTENAEELAHGD